MSNQLPTPSQTEQHLQLWTYYLPVVGIIPAIWTLYRTKHKIQSNHGLDSQHNPFTDYSQQQQQLKASRRSISLTLVWLCSYILLTSGASSGTEITSFRFLYANAISTTGYFLVCTFLMSRLGKKRLFSADKIN
ncbi:MAG: hypothetical protein AAF652_00745 [Cyanobacteria bacterium P01_C01_bin.72]